MTLFMFLLSAATAWLDTVFKGVLVLRRLLDLIMEATMAIPQDRSTIRTNISRSELNAVLKAIEDERAVLVPGSHALYNESRCWQVDYQGARYEIKEFTELLTSVQLISA